MGRQLWKAIATLATALQTRPRPGVDYTDADVVAVFYWAVIRDRSISWARLAAHWPIDLRRRRLPSNSAMSRRLRRPSVRALLEALERRVTAPTQPHLFRMIDGEPPPIGGCSKDRQAGYGRAAACKARGCKLHPRPRATAAWPPGGWPR